MWICEQYWICWSLHIIQRHVAHFDWKLKQVSIPNSLSPMLFDPSEQCLTVLSVSVDFSRDKGTKGMHLLYCYSAPGIKTPFFWPRLIDSFVQTDSDRFLSRAYITMPLQTFLKSSPHGTLWCTSTNMEYYARQRTGWTQGRRHTWQQDEVYMHVEYKLFLLVCAVWSRPRALYSIMSTDQLAPQNTDYPYNHDTLRMQRSSHKLHAD